MVKSKRAELEGVLAAEMRRREVEVHARARARACV